MWKNILWRPGEGGGCIYLIFFIKQDFRRNNHESLVVGAAVPTICSGFTCVGSFNKSFFLWLQVWFGFRTVVNPCGLRCCGCCYPEWSVGGGRCCCFSLVVCLPVSGGEFFDVLCINYRVLFGDCLVAVSIRQIMFITYWANVSRGCDGVLVHMPS